MVGKIGSRGSRQWEQVVVEGAASGWGGLMG